jgi:hypothetical protein
MLCLTMLVAFVFPRKISGQPDVVPHYVSCLFIVTQNFLPILTLCLTMLVVFSFPLKLSGQSDAVPHYIGSLFITT